MRRMFRVVKYVTAEHKLSCPAFSYLATKINKIGPKPGTPVPALPL
jgi:hypothetical protein